MEQPSDLWGVSEKAVAGLEAAIHVARLWMFANSAVELLISDAGSRPEQHWQASRSVTVSLREEGGAIVTTVTHRSEPLRNPVAREPLWPRHIDIEVKYHKTP
jgi:hypothetical protein